MGNGCHSTYRRVAIVRLTLHGLGGGVAFCQFGGEVGRGHDPAGLPHYGNTVGYLVSLES